MYRIICHKQRALFSFIFLALFAASFPYSQAQAYEDSWNSTGDCALTVGCKWEWVTTSIEAYDPECNDTAPQPMRMDVFVGPTDTGNLFMQFYQGGYQSFSGESTGLQMALAGNDYYLHGTGYYTSAYFECDLTIGYGTVGGVDQPAVLTGSCTWDRVELSGAVCWGTDYITAVKLEGPAPPPMDAERAALMALYNATTGASWTDSTGWGGTAESVCVDPWFGVTCVAGTVTALELPNNNLIGSIPAAIGDLANLEILKLQRNKLTGTIPAEVGNLTKLQILSLRSNELDGPIPTELEKLTALTELYLRNNELSGPIPAGLGKLTLLKVLSLRSNRLTGTIPAELGNLTLLERLFLRSNVLRGEIPSTLVNLQQLIPDELHLGFNGLHSDDATLVSFINTVHKEKDTVRDFSLTQTVDADGVVTTTVGNTEVDLAWNAVPYTDDPGGYRIYQSLQANSGFSMVTDVPDKLTTTATLTGLTACTTYFVRGHSYTSVHLPDTDVIAGNKSEVESDGETGNLLEFKTVGCPTSPPPPPPPAGGGGGCSVYAATPFDPLLPLLVVIAVFYVWQRTRLH